MGIVAAQLSTYFCKVNIHDDIYYSILLRVARPPSSIGGIHQRVGGHEGVPTLSS
jgi:hypothetical protein